MQTLTEELAEMSDHNLALIKRLCREDLDRFYNHLRHFLTTIDGGGPTLFKHGVLTPGQYETVRRVFYDLSQVRIRVSALSTELEQESQK